LLQGKGADIQIQNGTIVTFIACHGMKFPMVDCCTLPAVTCPTPVPTPAPTPVPTPEPTPWVCQETAAPTEFHCIENNQTIAGGFATETACAAACNAPAEPTGNSSIMTVNVISCAAAIAIALLAAALLHERRKRSALEREKGSVWTPLLEAGTGAAAEFCERTGAPVNAAAEAEVACEWRVGVDASGDRARVVELQFKVLAHATGGFDESRNIGGGASCAVYSGRVFGVDVAIKRLKDDAVEWEAKQYASEMALLQRASHANICRLLAFSSDGPSKCLVLELCPGGSLEGRLGQPVPVALTWQQRVRIAQQIALALVHLHDLKPQMIHRQDICNTPP
jgi:serine/threonine protein kinase